MVIRRIFGNPKNRKNRQELSKINSSKEIFVKKRKKLEDDESGDSSEFRDGFNIFGDMFKYEYFKDVKKIKISNAEEGSDQETLKHPKLKNKKVDVIYSDFTGGVFDVKEGRNQSQNDENAISNTVITDNVGNKIVKPIKRNKNKNSIIGF
jgi:hypothetical protein